MRPAVLPVVAALAAGLAAWYCRMAPDLPQQADRLAFAGAITSVSVTMLGFMLAALAVVASINHTHLVSMMKRTGHYLDLLLTMFAGAAFFLLCALAGYLMLFGYAPGREGWAFLAATHSGALVGLLDLARKLWLVLTHLRSDE